jgi:hypothetical protein
MRPGVLGEHFEQRELGGGEFDRRIGQRGLVMEKVELQGSGDDFRALSGETTALDDIQPRQQLGGAEGFGDVVVGSEFEGLDLHGFLIAHAQDEHGHVGPLAQTFEHLDPAEAGQAEIEQDDVGTMKRGFLQAELAIGGLAYLVAA